LKRKPDGTCMFFDDNKNICDIYEHRPLICMCFLFFLDGSGLMEVRHCYGTHQQMEKEEAFGIGKTLLRYHTGKIRNYIAICQGIGEELVTDKLCEVGLEDGIVLHVFDGECTTFVEYSKTRGFWLVHAVLKMMQKND
jgi:Fe-S-cluster containining protein